MHISQQETLEDLFFVKRGYLNVNHFVYQGVPSALIDTGCIADYDTTRRITTGLDVDLAEVTSIVATYSLYDHIGGNNRIQQLTGCDIFLHDIGKVFIETRDAWATWWKYYNQ